MICQVCGKSRRVKLNGGDNFRSGVAKCVCGNTFQVVFEKRTYYRKKIDSYAKCFAEGDPFDGVIVKMIDISRNGIRFTKTAGRPLQLKERIKLSFSLGKDTICCFASVYNVHNGFTGAKFIDLEEHSKKVLGFFLLP